MTKTGRSHPVTVLAVAECFVPFVRMRQPPMSLAFPCREVTDSPVARLRTVMTAYVNVIYITVCALTGNHQMTYARRRRRRFREPVMTKGTDGGPGAPGDRRADVSAQGRTVLPAPMVLVR